MDVEDSRFKAIYNNPLYNIDPSAPEYKKTKGTEALVEEKFRQRSKKVSASGKLTSAGEKVQQDTTTPRLNRPSESKNDGQPVKDSSLACLVKSVKAKTRTVQQKKKKLRPS